MAPTFEVDFTGYDPTSGRQLLKPGIYFAKVETAIITKDKDGSDQIEIQFVQAATGAKLLKDWLPLKGEKAKTTLDKLVELGIKPNGGKMDCDPVHLKKKRVAIEVVHSEWQGKTSARIARGPARTDMRFKWCGYLNEADAVEACMVEFLPPEPDDSATPF